MASVWYQVRPGWSVNQSSCACSRSIRPPSQLTLGRNAALNFRPGLRNFVLAFLFECKSLCSILKPELPLGCRVKEPVEVLNLRNKSVCLLHVITRIQHHQNQKKVFDDMINYSAPHDRDDIECYQTIETKMWTSLIVRHLPWHHHDFRSLPWL